MPFKDHFSGHASAYALSRPGYPAALFDWLADVVSADGVVWDCATGNGQAAVSLAERFGRIVATDPSTRQLGNARPHPGVRYLAATAEAPPFAAASMDLITVAQALHWFDRDRFFVEVRRVLKPGGLVAVWCYGWVAAGAAADEAIGRYRVVVESFWPPERAIIEDRYRSIAFPFDEVTTPAFAMAVPWTADQLAAYIATWSATRRMLERQGDEALRTLAAELRAAWGSEAHRVAWPLAVRAGRVTER